MFVAGGLSAIAASLASYPFDLARTAFAAQGLPKARHALALALACGTLSMGDPLLMRAATRVNLAPLARSVARGRLWRSVSGALAPRSGVAASEALTAGMPCGWQGSSTTVIQAFPFMAANFALYDWGRRAWLRSSGLPEHSQQPLPPVPAALVGGAAGVVAKTLVYPLDTVKKRVQVRSSHTRTLVRVGNGAR